MHRITGLAFFVAVLATGSSAAARLSPPCWLVALPAADGGVHLSWRMNRAAESVTSYTIIRDRQEIATTKLTNYVDRPPPGEHEYTVRARSRERQGRACRPVSITAGAEATNVYRVIPAVAAGAGERMAIPVSLGFLDRDELVDFVCAYGREGSAGVLRAYTHAGELLWERAGGDVTGAGPGPLIWDVDRDGAGEVVCLERGTGLVVLDGRTGKVEAENATHPVIAWHDGPATLQVADLEGRGRSWAVVLKRGNSGELSQPLVDAAPTDPASGEPRPQVAAFSAKLEPLWWVALNCGAAHHMRVADIDLDGRDDVVASGAVTLGPEGQELFRVDFGGSPRLVAGEGSAAPGLDGFAEADSCVVGDVAPNRPGLEIVVKGAQEGAPMCMYGADGEAIWYMEGVGGPGGRLILGDLFADAPGLEVVSQGAASHWLSANGSLLTPPRGLRRFDVVDWSGLYPGLEAMTYDAARNLIEVRSPSVPTAGPLAVLTYEGRLAPATVRAADIIGDYREEIIADWGGRVVVFTNTEADVHARPSVWQDRRLARWRYINAHSGVVVGRDSLEHE
ncbi:MAG: hypothetical protein ACE5R4_11440 [Armatimonadota bacterium]